MQVAYVPCPHCRNQLVDDGRFAGQVVQCPTCQQQFQMPIQATPVIHNMAAPVQDPFAFCSKPTTAATRYVPPRPKPSNQPSIQVWGVVIGAILLLVGVGLQQYGSRDLQQPDHKVQKSAEFDRATAGMSSTQKGMYKALRDKLGDAEGAIAYDNLMAAHRNGLNLYGLHEMDSSDFLRELRGLPVQQQQAAMALRHSGWKGGDAAKTGQK